MIVIAKFVHQLNFYRYKENQVIDLEETLERFWNVLHVFGFNSAKYDLNLIKSYFLPILVNERDIEPTVMKKANQFISFKFGDIQLLDIMNIVGGATTLDSFLKAYRTSETKGSFPYEWFDHPDKMQNTELPPFDAFYSKLHSCNLLEAEYTDYVNLLKSGLSTEQVVVKLKLWKTPPTGIENYQYLQQIWKQEQMSSFRDFLRWYYTKDVVPTLEAMQKMIAFYHDKDVDMLKLGCTLPNLANICLHKFTDAKFYPITERGKNLLEKIRKDVVVGPSIVFTRKAVVFETFIRKSANICKSVVGIDASQFYPYSMCQRMPTGLYTRWDLDSKTSNFTPGKNKTRSFENMVMSYFQQTRPECKTESFFTTSRQKRIDCFSVDGFCSYCNTALCSNPWVAFITSIPVKSCVLLSLKKIFNVVAKRESSMHWDILYKRKSSRLLKCGIANGVGCTKQPILVNNISNNTFLTGVHLQLSNF